MLDLSLYLMFLAASVALILVPGPAQALVVAKTLAGGRRSGALAAVGLNIGTLFHTATAALGLSAILATSALAFSIVKYAGAAYLIYLGIRAVRSKVSLAVSSALPDSSARSTLGQAIATGILNPKVALFFLAFLPQFVSTDSAHAAGQSAVLGLVFAAQTVLVFGLLGWFAGTIGGWLQRRANLGRRLDQATGVLFIGLGLRLAAESR